MGLNVVGYDPIMSNDELSSYNITPCGVVDNIWKQCDIITIHTPLTTLTNNLVNSNIIKKCKKGVIFVNCARGGVINETDLLEGLQSGHVAAAALDVYAVEPPTEAMMPLLKHPNVICTPHLGASTEEAQINVAKDIAVQICDYFDNRKVSLNHACM